MQAAAAAEAKSQFLARMSHEIRTPLNGMIAVGQLLAETALSPAQWDLVNTVRCSGETLLTLISDILDFSRIEVLLSSTPINQCPVCWKRIPHLLLGDVGHAYKKFSVLLPHLGARLLVGSGTSEIVLCSLSLRWCSACRRTRWCSALHHSGCPQS